MKENSYNEVTEIPSKKYLGFLKYRLSFLKELKDSTLMQATSLKISSFKGSLQEFC